MSASTPWVRVTTSHEACPAGDASRADLPMPGSPRMAHVPDVPQRTRASRPSNCAHSQGRPTRYGDRVALGAAHPLQEGYLLADPRTVQVVTENAARGIHDLERYGMRFDRRRDGRIAQRYFGAHTYRRAAFSGDSTGLEMQRVLARRARQLDVPVLSTSYITQLLVEAGRV